MRNRNRKRKEVIQAITESPKALKRKAKKQGGYRVPEGYDADRPKTRADCIDGPRPCPWVACKDHLYLDVNPESGAIKPNFPHLEVGQLQETCSRDVAARGGETLEAIGELMNLTRERVRQIEVAGLVKLRAAKAVHELKKLRDGDDG